MREVILSAENLSKVFNVQEKENVILDRIHVDIYQHDFTVIMGPSGAGKSTLLYYYRKAEKKLKREQRKLSKMQKDSKNREKQRVEVAKLHEKTAN